MKNQSTIVQKIIDLRRKAENDGCTEAEAMQCAAMASRLMSKHEVTADDLERAEAAGEDTGVGTETVEQKTKSCDDAIKYACAGIAKLAEVEIYFRSVKRGGRKVSETPVVVGLEADREFALYLIELVRGASLRGVEAGAGGQWVFVKR
jgi:hypothetical protein